MNENKYEDIFAFALVILVIGILMGACIYATSVLFEGV